MLLSYRNKSNVNGTFLLYRVNVNMCCIMNYRLQVLAEMCTYVLKMSKLSLQSRCIGQKSFMNLPNYLYYNVKITSYWYFQPSFRINGSRCQLTVHSDLCSESTTTSAFCYSDFLRLQFPWCNHIIHFKSLDSIHCTIL